MLSVPPNHLGNRLPLEKRGSPPPTPDISSVCFKYRFPGVSQRPRSERGLGAGPRPPSPAGLICFPAGCSGARVSPASHSRRGMVGGPTQAGRWPRYRRSTPGARARPPGPRAGRCAGTCWGSPRTRPRSAASARPLRRPRRPRGARGLADSAAAGCCARPRSLAGRAPACGPGPGRPHARGRRPAGPGGWAGPSSASRTRTPGPGSRSCGQRGWRTGQGGHGRLAPQRPLFTDGVPGEGPALRPDSRR